jgi:hypothetical protein
MLPVGFESTIPANERPQTYALDRTAAGNQLHYLVIIPNFDTISSELRTASSVRLGDLTQNTERLRDLQSFETIFDVGCIFPAQYLRFRIIYTKAANFSIKSINYLEFAMKSDCVLCGMGTEYPLYLSIHVSRKSRGIKRQCI